MNYEAYQQAHYDYWEQIGILSPVGEASIYLATEGRKNALPPLMREVSASQAVKILKVVKESAECLTKEEFENE